MKNKILKVFVFLNLLVCTLNLNGEKLRTIVTTDGEIDDQASFVRFLMYSYEWDVEGLIYASSRYHYKGYQWNGTNWMQETINRYSQVLGNLRKHQSSYPSVSYLKSKIKVGNCVKTVKENVGPGKDSPGSDLIVNVLRDSDSRKVYIQAWGGTLDIAQALWRIKTSYKSDLNKALDKAIIVNTGRQDEGMALDDWILNNFPQVTFYRLGLIFKPVAYPKMREETNPYYNHYVFSRDACYTHIKNNHGPLLANTPGAVFAEGDNICFYFIIPNGLRGYQNPTLGSWGGRLKHTKNNLYDPLRSDWKNKAAYKSVARWSLDFQYDYFAIADWCVKDYANANHHPEITAYPGDTVNAGAKGTTVNLSTNATDPDGDSLSYKWWFYKGPGSYTGSLAINNASSKNANFTVPTDEKKSACIILEVKDNGTPNMKRYKQIMVNFNSN